MSDNERFVTLTRLLAGLTRLSDAEVAAVADVVEDCQLLGTGLLVREDGHTHRRDPALVTFTVATPSYLHPDAPFAICGGCGRKTWATSEFGQQCRMPQPDGSVCLGSFSDAAQP